MTPFVTRLMILVTCALVCTGSESGMNKKQVLIWYAAFNQKAPDMIAEVVDPKWIDIPAAPGIAAGPDGLRRMLVQLTTTFPDFKVDVKEVLQDGNKVIVRSQITGTQRGVFLGVPPRNNVFSIQAVDIHEFKAGKIIRTWHTEDWMTGLRQLGILHDWIQPPRESCSI